MMDMVNLVEFLSAMLESEVVALMISVIWAIIFIRVLQVHHKTPSAAVLSRGVGSRLPTLSVIVPALDEEKNIAKCIRSLLKQEYLDLEVIVVVDSTSRDNTLAVAKEFEKSGKVKVIQNGSRPEGWKGKTWNCHVGYSRSKGDYLLFVDADSWFYSGDALRRAMAHAVDKGIDVLSCFPEQICHGFWSKAILPLLYMLADLFRTPPYKVNNPKSRSAYLHGAFILIRRPVYASVGGFESVKNDLVEDRTLGVRAKSRGHRTWVFDGRDYQASVASVSLRYLWTRMERYKAAFINSRRALSVFLMKTAAHFGIVLLLFLYPIYSAAAAGYEILSGGAYELDLLLIARWIPLGLQLAAMGYLADKYKINSAFAFAVPLASLLFLSMLLTAAYKALRGREFQWKRTGTERTPRVYAPDGR